MKTFFHVLLIVIASAPAARSQQLAVPKITATDDVALANALPTVANQIIAVYTVTAQDGYLSNLFRLQMVAADYSAARVTLAACRTELLQR